MEHWNVGEPRFWRHSHCGNRFKLQNSSFEAASVHEWFTPTEEGSSRLSAAFRLFTKNLAKKLFHRLSSISEFPSGALLNVGPEGHSYSRSSPLGPLR